MHLLDSIYYFFVAQDKTPLLNQAWTLSVSYQIMCAMDNQIARMEEMKVIVVEGQI